MFELIGKAAKYAFGNLGKTKVLFKPRCVPVITLRGNCNALEITVVSESPYKFAGMDARLRGKIISVKVRAYKS